MRMRMQPAAGTRLKLIIIGEMAESRCCPLLALLGAALTDHGRLVFLGMLPWYPTRTKMV